MHFLMPQIVPLGVAVFVQDVVLVLCGSNYYSVEPPLVATPINLHSSPPQLITVIMHRCGIPYGRALLRSERAMLGLRSAYIACIDRRPSAIMIRAVVGRQHGRASAR